jgi:hypothetical protein
MNDSSMSEKKFAAPPRKDPYDTVPQGPKDGNGTPIRIDPDWDGWLGRCYRGPSVPSKEKYIIKQRRGEKESSSSEDESDPSTNTNQSNLKETGESPEMAFGGYQGGGWEPADPIERAILSLEEEVAKLRRLLLGNQRVVNY